MTKEEKLRAIIHKDVSSGFMYELEKQLKAQAFFVKKLAAHPDFIPSVIDEIVAYQLPFYNTVSSEAVDKAYDFFMSDAGSEWCLLSAKFVKTLNEWAPPFVEDLVSRLRNLN